MQEACTTRQGSADEALVFGEAFEGARRGLEHGLVGKALMRADKRAQGLRDSEGEEDVRPRQLFVEVVLEPLLSFMVLTLRTMSIAACVIDAVLFPTALAPIEAMTVVSTTAVADGA
jgi:hypothetical protein